MDSQESPLESGGMDAPDTPMNGRFTFEKYEGETSTAVIKLHDSRQPHPILNPHIDRFYFMAPAVLGKRVLDLGCGFGYSSKILAGFAREVVGVDIDDGEIAWARANNPAANVTYKNCTLADLPDRFFEAAVCSEVLEHMQLADIPPLLLELKNRLCPGAVAIFTTPCQERTQRTTNRFHVQEFSYADFLGLLSTHFTPRAALWYDWNDASLHARHAALGIPHCQSPIVQMVFATPNMP